MSWGRTIFVFHSPGGGAFGIEEFRAGVWGRRWGAVLSGADVEGVAVWVCAGDHVGAAVGAADPRGSGFALPGGRSATGQLGFERISSAAGAGVKRRVHAGAGDGATDEIGAVGASGNRLDTDTGGGLAESAGDGRTAATGADPAATKHSQVAEAVR